MSKPLPKLLLLSRLLRPLRAGRELVDRISGDLNGNEALTLQQGAFALAVSAMEVGLSDSLKYFLQCFPEKVPREFVGSLVGSAQADMHELVESCSERYTAKLTFGSFRGFLKQYEKLLSVDMSSGLDELLAQVQEIKATRNLLLHNGLTVNHFYIEQAGEKRRESTIATALNLDDAYISASLILLGNFIDAVIEVLTAKYSCYTKLAANRNLWHYLFESPVMRYGDFWDVDEAEDRIVAMKKGPYEEGLSSSEHVFLGLWRAHFNGSGDYLKNLNMRSLDRDHGRRLHFVLSIARDFPWA